MIKVEERKTDVVPAVIGFLLSLIGVLVLGVVLGPLGVIVSLFAITRGNQRTGHRVLAAVGFVLGVVVTILSIVHIVSAHT